jgi:hypothetical protein
LVILSQPFKDLRPLGSSHPNFDGLLSSSFAVNDDENACLPLPFNDALIGQDEGVRDSPDHDFATSK